jgi:DNA-binding transcriptional regulator YiaG
MSALATALKDEIARLARKELKGEVEALKKASARYRTEIAALKRRIDAMEKEKHKAERQHRAAEAVAATQERQVRFSAPRLKKMRERLELSAADLGRLLGVAAQTIYNWEGGTTRPAPDVIRQIAAVRAMGKRALRERLAAAET